MINKLEAGKTYKLVDLEGYLFSHGSNRHIYENHFFNNCVTIEKVGDNGAGYVKNCGIPCIQKNEYQHFELVEDKPKFIKPEDEVTITTTYGELAKAYAVLGVTRGRIVGTTSLYTAIGNLLDPNHDKYNSFFRYGTDYPRLHYTLYQSLWLDTLFTHPLILSKLQEIEKLQQEIILLKSVKTVEVM